MCAGREGVERSEPLMTTLLRYGKANSEVTILEGILPTCDYSHLFESARDDLRRGYLCLLLWTCRVTRTLRAAYDEYHALPRHIGIVVRIVPILHREPLHAVKEAVGGWKHHLIGYPHRCFKQIDGFVLKLIMY